MLKDSMLGAERRVKEAEQKKREEERELQNQRNSHIKQVKLAMDRIIRGCYKAICDKVAEEWYRSKGPVSGEVYFNPWDIITDIGNNDSEEMTEEFTTQITLTQAEAILDKKMTGYVDQQYDDPEHIQILDLWTNRGGLGILKWVDTTYYSLTDAGRLIMDEIVRLGKSEGIDIIPGILFICRSGKNEIPEKTYFKPFRKNTVTNKTDPSSNDSTIWHTAFHYQYDGE